MTDAELLAWAHQARRHAVETGTLSGLWDLIMDAEAHAYGQQTLLPRDVVEAMVAEVWDLE